MTTAASDERAPAPLDLPWIQGARPVAPRTRTKISWQELLFRRLTGSFTGLPSGEKTVEAERILGLSRSIYYGIGRNSPEFGEVIAVFEPLEASSGGDATAPFDTGGIAHGHVPVKPGSPHPATILQDATVAVADHQSALRVWTTDAYDDARQYRAIENASRPRYVTTAAIDLDEARDERAWTWEGRIRAVDYATPPTRLRMVYFKEGRVRRYWDWIERAMPLEATELLPHEALINTLSIEVPSPYERMMEDLEGESYDRV